MWKKFLDNIQAILIITGFLILLLFFNQCNTTRKLKNELKLQKQVTEQNMAALNDTITVYKNKAGQSSYSKPIADMSPQEIEKYFPDLYKRLKAEMGEVKVIWKTIIEYRDTGFVKNAIVQLDSNKFSLNYNYYSKDSSLHILSTNTFFADPILIDKETNKYTVKTNSGISTINDFNLKLGFTTGIKKENGLNRIFITPDSKNTTVTLIEGADVSKLLNPIPAPSNNKKWSVGPYIGFGMTFTNGAYHIGPGVGISVQYSLLKF